VREDQELEGGKNSQADGDKRVANHLFAHVAGKGVMRK